MQLHSEVGVWTRVSVRLPRSAGPGREGLSVEVGASGPGSTGEVALAEPGIPRGATH